MQWWEHADIVKVNDPAALSSTSLQYWENQRTRLSASWIGIFTRHLEESIKKAFNNFAKTTENFIMEFGPTLQFYLKP